MSRPVHLHTSGKANHSQKSVWRYHVTPAAPATSQKRKGEIKHQSPSVHSHLQGQVTSLPSMMYAPLITCCTRRAKRYMG